MNKNPLGAPFNAGAKEDLANIDENGHEAWWYIQCGCRQHFCLYSDDKGRFYFAAKDLSHVVPVVWNDKRAAIRVARQKKGRVKKFPYLLQVMRR